MHSVAHWLVVGGSMALAFGCGPGAPAADSGASGATWPIAPALGASGTGQGGPSAGALAWAGASAGSAGGQQAVGAWVGAGATGGAAGTSAQTQTAGASAAGSAAASGGGTAGLPTEKFSFFVTSVDAMRELSGSDKGFGGDLRYKQSSGLAGADKICTDIAERSMPGAAKKSWRAFLSTQAGAANGGPIHARDRIGNGPWYDRTGRLVALNLTALLNTRPSGAEAAIADDLPNELGLPNHGSMDIDNHDTVTGSNAQGQYSNGSTCADWTSTLTPSSGAAGSGGRTGGGSAHNGPMVGHSWPAQSGQSWIQAHAAPGCAPSVSLVQNGGGSGDGIGNGGGYGGIYCFALAP